MIAGQDAPHVRAYGMQAAIDEMILARALYEDRAIVSADTGSGAILATQSANPPSFILFRDPNLPVAPDYAAMPIPALTVARAQTASGLITPPRVGSRWLSHRSDCLPQNTRTANYL